MTCNSHCIMCLAKRQSELAASLPDEASRTAYMCEVFRIISENAPHCPAPAIFGKLSEVQKNYFSGGDQYVEIKHKYNLFMLDREAAIAARIDSSADPLRTALLYARAGNYIDFGAMHSVDDALLEDILSKADSEPLDDELYRGLLSELEKAKKLVLITDNCGEIVLDKLLLSVISRLYPSIELSVLVKGSPAINDATEADALEIGMERYAHIVENGVRNGTPGTWLPIIPDETVQLLRSADLIIAKGQANFETLCDCGLPIYYLLMCKCQRFVEMTGQPLYSGLLLREGRVDFV